ncbi:MAG: hypothetical protein JKY94_10090 [Rhodobacteraceae bacterium]|nr:hypothetical protein [Paracoccaceae bacterium]
MAYMNDRIYDLGLNVLDTEADEIFVCSQEPANYTEAVTTYALGNSSSLSIGAPAAKAGGGRKVTIAAISDGAVSADGTATHYGIVDTVNSRLLLANTLDSSQQVYSGNAFTTAVMDFGIPAPA